MADLGVAYTDKKIENLTHKINGIYKEARKDINSKMKDFNEKYKVKEAKYAKQVEEGVITQEQFDNWKKGQVFQGKQWQAKKDEITNVLYNSNVLASKIVNSESIDVFGFNINYASYTMEHGEGVNFGFSVYDRNTVINLIKNEPNLLPMYTPKKGIDKAWNSKKITRQVTLGIMQGESLDKIANRLASVTSSQDKNSMLTHARTIMTGAQNAGRLESYRQAEKLGIELQKEWMASLDSHTRDSHADIDGERVDVESKFSNGLMYPAEPGGAPAEVYNCRCTMVSNIKKYPAKYQRRDNIDGKRIDNMSYKDWYETKYKKEFVPKSSIGKYKREMGTLQKRIKTLEDDLNSMNSDYGTFSGIWYKDVTLSDYSSKKSSVESKYEYYNEKLKTLNSITDPTQEQLEKIEKFEDLRDLLKEYETLGNKYLAKQVELENLQKQLSDIEKKISPRPQNTGVFSADAYSQARKDAALWAKNSKEADATLRPMAKEMWRNASDAEKRAAYQYTAGSGPFNRPLRGFEGSWGNFKGVGNVDLNYEGAGKMIEDLTNVIGRSTLQQDTWLQRGVESLEGAANFFQVSEDDLRKLGQEDLEKLLVGKEVTDQAFMSCGSSKGAGFRGTILNIYCPEGTQAIYCEPFSRFGEGDKINWDGISDQSSFGSELETLLQRNTTFKVTKVEKGKWGDLYIDLDVVDQRP